MRPQIYYRRSRLCRHLSLSPNLGRAYITVTNGNKAQFTIGWKGLVELAHRTGQYVRIHAGKVREGQIKDIDFVTGEIIRGEKISDEVVGYIAYFELVNGFNASLYMTVDELKQHAESYSQSYVSDLQKGRKSSPWSRNFDAMVTKTILKSLLLKYGRFDNSLAEVLQGDQAVIDKNTFTYVDNGGTVVQRDSLYVSELHDDKNIPDSVTAIPSNDAVITGDNTVPPVIAGANPF